MPAYNIVLYYTELAVAGPGNQGRGDFLLECSWAIFIDDF